MLGELWKGTSDKDLLEPLSKQIFAVKRSILHKLINLSVPRFIIYNMRKIIQTHKTVQRIQ